MYKKIIHTIVIFYLFSSFLSATHIHKAEQNSSNCKVCIVVKNIQGGDVPSAYELPQHSFIGYVPIRVENCLCSTSLIKGFNSQAPPLFS